MHAPTTPSWSRATTTSRRRSVVAENLAPSDASSVCPWKGTASYYDVVVDGQVNAGAAWYYPAPTEAAAQIKDHVAFWKGVTVSE